MERTRRDLKFSMAQNGLSIFIVLEKWTVVVVMQIKKFYNLFITRVYAALLLHLFCFDSLFNFI